MFTKIAIVAAVVAAGAGLHKLANHLFDGRVAALSEEGLTTTVADLYRSSPHGIVAVGFGHGPELWAVREGYVLAPRKRVVEGGKLILKADGKAASERDIASLGLPVVRLSYRL